MMDQTHIGYTRWQEPPKNIMPALAHVDPVDGAVPGVALEVVSALAHQPDRAA